MQYRQINLKFYENCWKIGRAIVALGQKEGTFSSNIYVDTAAKMIRSIIDGCLIQWLMCDEDHLHEFYKKTCYDVIFKYLK
ncbi:MAG TPA: hypothetical protein VEY68_00215 [Anoxybacillus sp.]|nr:hypothetical protein [Anoxybacillus sp.]